MTLKTKVDQSFKNLANALQRLEEALAEDKTNSLIVDATIQRFEFTVEIFWKALKRILAFNGIEAATPRDALKKAYAAGWLNNEELWIQMLNDRNETSHVYDENAALRIYNNIKNYFPELKSTYQFLTKIIAEQKN